ncbi:MAG: AarF/UbiB family protein [Coriobacteriia bacterium]|nr:AarF/UbiB family protein [Coriobacteriia bacterium]
MTSSQLRARYWRIVFFFAGVTANFIWWDIFLMRIGLGGWSGRTRAERYRRIAVRFRALAISMGGLMIKVGQFLSARLDVLPIEITQELAGLQDEVPAEEFSAIREQAEAELGEPIAGRYAWIDETPMAAASLGQVHRAKLCAEEAAIAGFEDVVIKVQRPHIEQVVDVDLAALRRVGGWLQRYKPVSKRADVRALVEEFAATTHEEIDYVAEAHNAETFAESFADKPRIRIPKVIWTLSSRRVLTLENVAAIKIGDYDAITTAGIAREDVAAAVLDAYMQMILTDGFFHADPHPGNLFVQPLDGVDEEGKRNWRLTFIDFGMVGRVPENLRAGLQEVLIAVGTQDAARLVQSYTTLGVLLPSADLKLIEKASQQLFERFWGMSMSDLKSLDHAELMRFSLQFRELVLDLPVQLPENLLLLGRTVALLSGMCTGLDPDFNLWTSISPYATKLISAEGGSTFQTFLAEATKIFQVLIGLPSRTDRVLQTLEHGELNVQTPLLNLRVRQLERAVGRINNGLVFAALLIAGAILYRTDVVLARWFMGGSALVFVGMMIGGRGGHGPRR